jgi:hypothetical protein
MSSERGRARAIAALASACLLAGCLLGPWDLAPQDQIAKVQLEVSALLVQGKAFDTLWIERPLTFANGYDSSLAFIDSSASKVEVIRTDVAPPETVSYRMSPVDTRAWLPVPGSPDTVRPAGRYRLEARIRWDAAREFPQAHAFRTDTLSAEAYVQRHYAIRDTAWVPLEALHPALSLGLPPALVARALADTAVLRLLYDSLESIRSLSRHDVGPAELRTYLAGGLVMRPLAKGDTAFYIFDASKVADPNPANPDPISRYSRQWRFIQDLDKRDFGGLALAYAYDTTGARILDPLTQALRNLFGRGKIDTARLYQRGNYRFLGITDKAEPGASGYPDTLAWGNRNLDYTGRDVIYFYAVDSLYTEYQRAANPGFRFALGGDGGGGGRVPANNAVHFSNIRGGDGYFSAAALDSFTVHLVAMKDTIPVPILHAASLARDQRRGGQGD